eukprot:5092373-Prorocentrum_lima.AAC.1
MTSSLVGSEMCIRDRVIVNTNCWRKGQQVFKWLAAQKDPVHVVCLQAVSYTHLTLPTICSV